MQKRGNESDWLSFKTEKTQATCQMKTCLARNFLFFQSDFNFFERNEIFLQGMKEQTISVENKKEECLMSVL